MRATTCLAVTLSLFILCGCKSIDPTTGQQVFDQVKTEKVRAVLKPVVSGAVVAVLAKNPQGAVYFNLAASAICEMRDTKQVNVETFRARLLGIIDQHATRVDPLIRTGFLTVIALFEINYADRLHADLSPEEFTWNLLDVLCDGIRGGTATPPTVAK